LKPSTPSAHRVALSSHGLNSGYARARFGLPEGGAATTARDALVRRGEVLTDPYRIADPVLRYWLGQRRHLPVAGERD
jgi:hypothetical protein